MKEFEKIFTKIMNKYNTIQNCIYEQVIYNENILPLTENELLKALNYIVYFKDSDLIIEDDEQKYFVQLPEQLEILVNENKNKHIKDELITAVFSELQFIENKSHIFCGVFSFSNIYNIKTFLKSIAKIKNSKVNLLFKLVLDKNNNGVCIDLRKVDSKLNLIFLLFNEDNYTRRTIYHEFTHYLQNVVGDKYLKILNANIRRTKLISKKLAKFNLTLDTINKIYFSDKEYITQIDNLIYLITEVWKVHKNKYLTKFDLLEKFFNEFSTDDSNILNSEFALEIINVHKTFRNSILFFICAYICFKENLFLDLKRNLEEKFS